MDELLGLLKAKTDVLKLLGQMWELLYIESKSPDVGIRRENLVRLLLRKEIGLEVEPAPPMERSWDFKVIIGEREKFYSLKTAEGPSAIKVAWNGFPSMQRARRHQFVHPILYIKNDRKRNEISVAVFDVSDLETVQREMGNAMWWMPRGGTNPRGFGISSRAV
ncbi:MAG: hypothetical protein RMK31_01935, partial [Candidatus Caldarchaeum sp.]|nr:hypothetical protein [Candidatus Caldarchaeum sp.]